MTPKSAFLSLLIAAASIVVVFISSRSANEPKRPESAPVEFELPASFALEVTSFDTFCDLKPWVSKDIWISNMGGVRWPVAASRVRAAADRLRAQISEGSIASEREDDARYATVVEFVEASSRTRVTMRSGLGAAAEYRVESADLKEPLIVSSGDAAARMFTPDSLRMWREATALIAVKGKDKSFVAKSGGLHTELARGVQGWKLAQPVVVSANNDIVNMQIGALRTMRARRILSVHEVPQQMFDTPLASFELATELDGRIGALLERLEIGGPADLSNQTVFVRAEAMLEPLDGQGSSETAWGPAVLVVDRADVERLTADWRVYASARASDVIKADVLSVVIRSKGQPERKYDRRIEGWSESGQSVNALLALMCDADASFTHLESDMRSEEVLGEIELRGGAGVLETLILRAPGAQSKSNLMIQSGGVTREYAVNDELLQWLVAR